MSALLVALLALTAAENKVSAELIADAQDVDPGATFRAGVLFRLPENAHIYWRNPGDSGLATGVEWDLPEGVTAGDLQWPNPIQFSTPGLDDVSYGYTNEVLLFAEFRIDNRVSGRTIEIGARAYWLLCEDDGTCIPEETNLTAELTIGKAGAGRHAAIFERYAARMPQPYKSFNELRHAQPLLLDEPTGLMLYAQPPWRFVAQGADHAEPAFFPETGADWAFHMDLAETDADVPDNPRALSYRPSEFVQFYTEKAVEPPIRGVLTLPLENAETNERVTIYAIVPDGLLPHP